MILNALVFALYNYFLVKGPPLLQTEAMIYCQQGMNEHYIKT